MTKARKLLGMFLIALFTISTCLSAAPVQAAVKKPAAPKLVLVAQPKAEYNVGERVTVQVKAPNYSGKVQYRAILWDGNKKVQRELWPTMPGYYYKNWIPTGPTTFTIGWPVMEPGPYSLTVLVKRSGVKVPYDSYVKTISFVVKETVVSKDVTLDKAGQTYGPDASSKPETIEKDLYIKADNVTLRNVVVKGTVFVDPGKDGSTNLENVTAKNIKVLSGGQNSIHVKNVKAEGMDVDSSSPVRIEADGDTEIVATTANGYVIFDKKNGTYGTITITASENGENVIEFRGDIKDKVVVEAAAEIKAAEGSIENLEIATEKKDDVVTIQGTVKSVEVNKEATVKASAGAKIEEMKVNTAAKIVADKAAEVAKVAISTQKKDEVVKLEGTIKAVEVNKEATVQVAAGTKIETVVVNTEATINVEQGATVGNLDANNNKVVLDNKGTVEKKEDAGSVVPPQTQQPPQTQEPPVIITPTPTVYTENNSLNSSITSFINTVLGYGIINDVLDVTPTFANSDGTSTINVAINNAYSSRTVETTANLVINRAANRTLTSSDAASMTALRTTLTNVNVGGKALSLYVADMLQAKGETPKLEAFLRCLADTSKNVNDCINAYNDMLPSLSTYDYDKVVSLARTILVNGELSIPNMTAYGLTLDRIYVADAQIYGGNDTTISLADVRNMLGAPSGKTLGDSLISELAPKTVTVIFKGASGAAYTYNITVSVSAAH